MQPALRHPPPFQLELGRDRAWSCISAGLAALAGLALLAALAGHFGWRVWLAAPLIPLLGWAWWRLSGPGAQRLRWDGQGWLLLEQTSSSEAHVHVLPVMDFDNWLLLRLRTADGSGWQQVLRRWLQPHYLAVSRGDHAPHWTLLRATLYAHEAR